MFSQKSLFPGRLSLGPLVAQTASNLDRIDQPPLYPVCDHPEDSTSGVSRTTGTVATSCNVHVKFIFSLSRPKLSPLIHSLHLPQTLLRPFPSLLTHFSQTNNSNSNKQSTFVSFSQNSYQISFSAKKCYPRQSSLHPKSF